jgi:hypothetical protein
VQCVVFKKEVSEEVFAEAARAAQVHYLAALI